MNELSQLRREKINRIKYKNITLLGHLIIVLWNVDYLIIPTIASKIKNGLTFIKTKLSKIRQKNCKKIFKLKKDGYKSLSKRKLIEFIKEYDNYIQIANEENTYEKGWYPVCIREFYDCEYQEITKKKSVFNMIKSIVLNIMK